MWQLVREDGQDKHLARLIGPKLYEANWRDLTKVREWVSVGGSEGSDSDC